MAGTPYVLNLHGPFRLQSDGARIDVSSRRSQAMLAMLASSRGGDRTRSWLQDRLWSSRATAQAQASLRRELSNLRRLVNRNGRELLHADHARVWIDLSLVTMDLAGGGRGELLEGIDLPGEEGFEDWLRQERSAVERIPAPSAAVAAPALPVSVIVALTSLRLEPISGSDDIGELFAERLSLIRWIDVQPSNGGSPVRFRAGGQIRPQADGSEVLTLKLTDETSGRLLWSGRFASDDWQAPAPSAIDEAISMLRARIAQAEQARCHALEGEADDIATLVWQSQWHMHRMNRKDAVRAAELAQRALDLNPASSEAISQRTWVQLWDLWVTRAQEEAVRSVREQAQRAIIADHEDARGHMLAGIAEIWLMQPLRAEALLRRSVELDPSLVMAHVQLACALYHRLMLPESEAALHTALRLSPNDQYLFFIAGELATTCLMQDKCEEALVHAETSLAARRSYVHGHVAKVNALVRLGRTEEAAKAHRELYRANPNYSPNFIDWIPFLDSSWNAFFKDGLNRAAALAD